MDGKVGWPEGPLRIAICTAKSSTAKKKMQKQKAESQSGISSRLTRSGESIGVMHVSEGSENVGAVLAACRMQHAA